MHRWPHNPARRQRLSRYTNGRQLDRPPIPKPPDYSVFLPILSAHLQVINVAHRMGCLEDDRAIEVAHAYVDKRHELGKKAVGRAALNGQIELLIGAIIEQSLDCDANNVGEQLASASLGIHVGRVAMHEAGAKLDRR